jgi:hypothetical protein
MVVVSNLSNIVNKIYQKILRMDAIQHVTSLIVNYIKEPTQKAILYENTVLLNPDDSKDALLKLVALANETTFKGKALVNLLYEGRRSRWLEECQ